MAINRLYIHSPWALHFQHCHYRCYHLAIDPMSSTRNPSSSTWGCLLNITSTHSGFTLNCAFETVHKFYNHAIATCLAYHNSCHRFRDPYTWNPHTFQYSHLLVGFRLVSFAFHNTYFTRPPGVTCQLFRTWLTLGTHELRSFNKEHHHASYHHPTKHHSIASQAF